MPSLLSQGCLSVTCSLQRVQRWTATAQQPGFRLPPRVRRQAQQAPGPLLLLLPSLQSLGPKLVSPSLPWLGHCFYETCLQKGR